MINLYNKNKSQDTLNGGKINFVQKPAVQANFLKYHASPDNIAGTQLQHSIWFLHHEVLFYRLLVSALLLAIIGLWGVSIWGWFDYVVFGLSKDKQLSYSAVIFPDYSVFEKKFAPQPIQILKIAVLESAPGKVDLAAEVANLNQQFLARFDYSFIVNGQTTQSFQGFILPGEEKLLAVSGLDAAAYGGTPDLILGKIVWQRISAHAVPNPVNWQTERLNFTVSDIKITRKGGSFGASAYAIEFKLLNDSAYSFINPDFYVGLYQGRTLVGVLPLRLDRFLAGETRSVDLRSFASGINPTEVRVFPSINLYDTAVFVQPL